MAALFTTWSFLIQVAIGEITVLKPGKTYADVFDTFRWEIPEYYNIGVDICDRWADQRNRLALFYEN